MGEPGFLKWTGSFVARTVYLREDDRSAWHATLRPPIPMTLRYRKTKPFRLLPVLSLVVLGLVGAPRAAWADADSDAQDLFVRGRDLRGKKDCAGAVDLFRKANGLAPQRLGSLRNPSAKKRSGTLPRRDAPGSSSDADCSSRRSLRDTTAGTTTPATTPLVCS